MLFRTVYGQELETIYKYLSTTESTLSRQDIVQAFVPMSSTPSVIVSPQNVEDALSFLVSSQLIKEADGFFTADYVELPFRLALLQNLRRIEIGILEPKHPLDPLFMRFLNDLFVQPDIAFIDNLYSQANSLIGTQHEGGISKEKIQAWKRVMEYLGLGYRVQNGFLHSIHPSLLQDIIGIMRSHHSTLQNFFEQNLACFLPYLTRSGDVSQGIRETMLSLVQAKQIHMTTLQDSPSKAYFQPQNLRYITRGHSHANK